MDLKKVVLNDLHEQLGAKMAPFAGYNMPVRYSSDIEEHNNVRNGVGIFDVSHMGEILVKGPQALDLLQHITTNDVSALSVGKAQYSCITNENGGIVDDIIIYKIGEEEYMLVVNASNIEKDWDWISSKNIQKAELVNISDQIGLFAVQGPLAAGALQSLTAIDLSAMRPYTFEKGTFADVPNVLISATGYTGSGGFEIYFPNTYAREVWDKIFDAGKAYDIKPVGLGARDTLRLEMGYSLYGNDLNDTTTPLEAGLGWITKFTKRFIGDDILKRQKEKGVEKRLVGFELLERGIPREGYAIQNTQGQEIGKVTSGTQSPTLSKGIGLGYVEANFAVVGEEIYIRVRNKQLKAQIVKPPFYKK
jgi:aminomethyltransferase